MNAQDAILKQFMMLKKNPTLQEMSQETGIQVTRVFRLLNGSSMKLDEYLIFRSIVEEGMGCNLTFSAMLAECSNKLSIDALKDIESYIKRKLQLFELLNCNKTKQAHLSIA